MNQRPPGVFGVLRLLSVVALRRLLRSVHLARASRPALPSGRRRATARRRSPALVALFVVLLPFLFIQPVLMAARAVDALVAAASARHPDERLAVAAHTFWYFEQADEDLARVDPSDRAARAARLDRLRHDLTRTTHAWDRTPQELVAHFERHGSAGFRLQDPYHRFWVTPKEWPRAAAERQQVERGAALILLALLVAVLLSALAAGNVELGRVHWSMPWLLTFPVATRTLTLAKALEYGLVSLMSWLALFPFLLVLYLAAGQGSGAVPRAALATLALSLVLGSVKLWFETWLRLRLPLRRLRSVQGTCTLGGMLLFVAIVAGTFPDHVPTWFLAVVRATPDWLRAVPLAWPVHAPHASWTPVLLAAVFAVALTALAVHGTARLLHGGTLQSAGVTPGARGTARWTLPSPLRGMLGKELLLLLRDRAFLVRTLVVPALMVVLQIVLNRGVSRAVADPGMRWRAVVAYGIGTYALIAGCFQVLSGEGRALWLLYAQPVQLASALRRKIRLWTTVGTGFALAATLLLVARNGIDSWPQLASDLGFVVAGVWLAGYLATGVAALGVNPTADHVPRHVPARYAYLYLFLAGTYVAGLQSAALAPRIAGLLLFATLTFALWHRIRARLPYLLDPEDQPERGVSLYDAAVAAMSFFVLQALVFALAARAMPATEGRAVQASFFAFSLAGALTALVFLLVARARGLDLRDTLGLRMRSPGAGARALAAGTAAGAALGGLALVYARWLEASGLADLPAAVPLASAQLTYLLLLAVGAAPLCEELLFRGLLYRSLAGVVPGLVAVPWSAAVFAVCHPTHSWPPVFALGLACAALYRRTGYLGAAVAVHAAYNAVVVVAGT